MDWVQIVSWHVIGTWYRVPGSGRTLCGREVSGALQPASQYPPHAKTCETCLRVLAKRQTRQAGEE